MVAPLEYLHVIDITQGIAGPSCTQMLAWLGASVVKVEPLGTGDPERRCLQDVPDTDSLGFVQLNTNKRSIAVDLASPDGARILRDLLAQADLFVEDRGPAALEGLGLAWDSVHTLNPRLIMGSLSCTNPGYRYQPAEAFDALAQCMGGAASNTGWNMGPNDAPLLSGSSLGDVNAGMHLLIGLLAALQQRSRTGDGCHVEQSMQNAVLNLGRVRMHDQAFLDTKGYLPEYPNYPYQKQGRAVPRVANAEGGGELGWCYRCKGWETDPNAYVYVVVQQAGKGFEEFCDALGLESWKTDPRYNTPEARFEHKRDIYAAVEKYTITRDKYEVTKALGAAGVPCGPVLSWAELAADDELAQAGLIASVDQGGARGTFKVVGCPILFSSWKPTIGPAPALGADTARVLSELEYTEAQVDELREKGVVG